MTERYVFEYIGATFRVDVNLDGPTTTEPPNLRTIEGTWKTAEWAVQIAAWEARLPHRTRTA